MGCDTLKRRAVHIHIADEAAANPPLSEPELRAFEEFDLIYRSLCGLMFNYVPMSGHPGGSISSGRFVSGLLFDGLDYDLADPERNDADIISYAAGHKALGLYGMWAMRNEVARQAAPELLPADTKHQLRLEDLLGFRRNPVTDTPLFREFSAKPLDGHPTPATPFVRLSTGASGVGVATSLGLAYGARDYYGKNAPKVHIVEGEGGLTPGRVAEAMAAAGTAQVDNVVLHVDWNQASIDSNAVCRDGDTPGDYVQWNPMELALLNDWNVIEVEDGRDFQQVIAAQRKAKALDNGQPTAIVYRTTKGWQYGIEGRASHGAGHKLCSDPFFEAVRPLTELTSAALPCCDGDKRCDCDDKRKIMEECYWEALQVVRKAIAERSETTGVFAARLRGAKTRLEDAARQARADAPSIDKAYELAKSSATKAPEGMLPTVGEGATLRGELGKVLGHYNNATGGAFLAAAADLLGSTSVNMVAGDAPGGFWNTISNPAARLLSIGGICEDAMAGILAGLSTFGHHVGVGSSYGAFIAPLAHIPARLHAIGSQSKHEITGQEYRPMIVVCAHAGLKTGEDGPTHADPQPLQLVQGNFPVGTSMALTPWDPAEVWTLFSAALAKRPAVLFPFVTRPTEMVLDRAALGLAPVEAAAQGVYRLRAAKGESHGTIVLQGSGVTYAFLEGALPRLNEDGIDLDIYYIASEELFDTLSADEREAIFPAAKRAEAMGITGFTMPTLYRWVTSDKGRDNSLYPFMKGHFLGSGQADQVLAEAGLDGEAQYRAVLGHLGR